MSGARTAVRTAVILSVVTLVVAIVGFVVTLILNAFVLDKYNAYGEVPIPGSGSVQLPAGQVTVSFHTAVIGTPNGGGLPVPQLGMRIDPPDGVPDPAVTESYGSTTTVNNDSHVYEYGWFKFRPRARTTSRPRVRSTDTSTRDWRLGAKAPTARWCGYSSCWPGSPC